MVTPMTSYPASFRSHAATEETNVPVVTDGLFLTDTGGGYMEGSPDITRTFAFGKLSDQMKEDFTTVLKCNLHLARAVFLYEMCIRDRISLRLFLSLRLSIKFLAYS